MTQPRLFGIDDLDALSKIVMAGDFKSIEHDRVEPDTRAAPKSWSKDLSDEWIMLLRQYGAGTAIAFSIPLLTPLIRRKIDYDHHINLFYRLWDEYEDRLLTELTTRWLVSVSDTFFIDPRDTEEEAWAFCGAYFMKTIKLYETEMLRLNDYPNLSDPIRRIDAKAVRSRYGRAMLFDGVQPFHLGGNGDMVDKMIKRLEGAQSKSIAYKVMRELMRRACRQQTVFRRIDRHVKSLP